MKYKLSELPLYPFLLAVYPVFAMYGNHRLNRRKLSESTP